MSGVKRYPPIHEFDGAEFVKASDFDALTQQLAASEARATVNAEDCNEAERKLAARDKRLEEAVALLRRASRCCQGRGAGALKEAIKTFLSPAEAKEND